MGEGGAEAYSAGLEGSAEDGGHEGGAGVGGG